MAARSSTSPSTTAQPQRSAPRTRRWWRRTPRRRRDPARSPTSGARPGRLGDLDPDRERRRHTSRFALDGSPLTRPPRSARPSATIPGEAHVPRLVPRRCRRGARDWAASRAARPASLGDQVSGARRREGVGPTRAARWSRGDAGRRPATPRRRPPLAGRTPPIPRGAGARAGPRRDRRRSPAALASRSPLERRPATGRDVHCARGAGRDPAQPSAFARRSPGGFEGARSTRRDLRLRGDAAGARRDARDSVGRRAAPPPRAGPTPPAGARSPYRRRGRRRCGPAARSLARAAAVAPAAPPGRSARVTGRPLDLREHQFGKQVAMLAIEHGG